MIVANLMVVSGVALLGVCAYCVWPPAAAGVAGAFLLVSGIAIARGEQQGVKDAG